MQDEDIIELYFLRSENAIKETEIKYGKLCAHVIKNILKDSEDVEEVLNDTYLGVWNSIPPTRPSVFSVFLCKIARNLALKKYEYISAQKRNPEVLVSLSELEECVTDCHSQDIRYGTGDLGAFINEFLRGEKQEQRIVFIRRYWYNDSVKEICKRCHMSKSKVETILFRMRKKLRKALEEEGFEL